MALVLRVASLTGEPKPVGRLGDGGCDEKSGSGILGIAVGVQKRGMVKLNWDGWTWTWLEFAGGENSGKILVPRTFRG